MGASLRITLGQHSRAGIKGLNQDFHGALLPHEPLLGRKGIAVALADGIGSSDVSQIASAAAVRCFLDDYYAISDAWSVRRAAQRVLAATNAWLHAQTLRGAGRFDPDSGYCCTFSALILKGREAHLLHVGDARVYRLHERALEQLSEDHRIQHAPGESYLARALGAQSHVDIDYRRWPTEVGEIYLLATDGAHAHLDAAAVHRALADCSDEGGDSDFDAAALALADLVQARGGEDDITLQLLRIDALPEQDTLPWQQARAHLALPPPLAPGMAFEGYTLQRALQIGARSHVHLAVDQATGREVVLKTPSVDLRGDDGYLDRFVFEEWVARRIDSPHVLKAHERSDEAQRSHLYVALEYIDGQTLAQWMVDHPRPDLDSVRALVEQLARGLQALHRREMLHQDLRPENVMIDRHGTVKLIDLGAVHVPGLTDHSRAQAQSLVGSLQYAAPEYFINRPATARADLFSLAVLTYQMLGGQLPYGLEVARLRSAADLRRLRYVPLRHLRPELPDWLDAVLRKALSPDPARRQEAVSELSHDLRAPGPQFQRQRTPPLAERNPVRFWQATTALLALAVVALLGWIVSAPA